MSGCQLTFYSVILALFVWNVCPPTRQAPWKVLWTPCPSHRIFQARAVCIGCHLIWVHRAAVVQEAPVGAPVVLGEELSWGLWGRCRTTPQIQVTKADTCVYTSGVLGSPHQRPEKETRPWARFLHTRGPPESAWGMKGKVSSGVLSASLCLKELLHVTPARTLSCPQNPSTTPECSYSKG